ncbi:TonB-dependent receptor [Arenicella xantha]|uniref:Outer membrane receptor protein involved in Fe transport n=1 Tax=Arenicella xantha TaxID=644221 RepID=A0A395JMS1_9GAMM|nr:TonB-dependent receptor [Arenicella xantha]RBP51117.1 outer membrane receptor protein involved in Fe transport [Arenicella xantha]
MKHNQKYKAITAAILALTLSSQANAEDQKNDKLEEVLVTAQKRVQNAQRVPVAVTKFSGQQLRELGVTDVLDLQTSAPALIVGNTQSASTTSFSIRGVGTSAQNFGLESSVGLYVDGVYRARQSSVINELIDIEAIEVLRGPQGTLFGRNTPSGAVQIKTNAPSHEAGGNVSLSAGNFGLLSASAAGGGSLIDDVLAVRVTGFTSQRDGHVSDENFGEDVLNDRNRFGGRLQFLYTPSETFSARLIADYSEIDEICCAGVTVRNNFVGADGQLGSDALLTAFGGNIISEDQVFDDVSALNSLPISKNEDSGVSLELNFGDEDSRQLTSITAVRSFDQFTSVDADFSNVDLFTRVEDSETSAFSQELRFTNKSEIFEYVVGAYYFEQEIKSGAQFNVGSAFSPFLAQDPSIGQLIGAATAAGIPVADITPAGSGSRDSFVQDHQSTAIFGQIDFRATDNVMLSAGLRYTDEQKEMNGVFTQGDTGPAVDLGAIASGDPRSIVGLAFPGWGYTLGGPLTVVSARDNVEASLDDSQLTGTAKLAYTPNKQTMFYVSYGTGFKSGGTNTDRIAPQFSTVFGAETSKSLEIGVKKDFPSQGLRVNLSLHNTTTEDFQSIAFAGNGFNLINAGEVETRGGELEVLWYPTDSLSISGAVVLNDGEFTSFPGSTCWTATPFQLGQNDPTEVNGVCDRSGDPLNFNPEEVFMLAVNKQFTIGQNDAYLHADYFHRSSVFEDGDLDPLKEQSGYGLLNLRAGMFFSEGSTEWSFWVRNALDEDYLGTYFDVPLQTGKLNAYAREPRTFGVSIRKDF